MSITYSHMTVSWKVTTYVYSSLVSFKYTILEEQPHKRVIITWINDELIANLCLNTGMDLIDIWAWAVFQTVFNNVENASKLDIFFLDPNLSSVKNYIGSSSCIQVGKLLNFEIHKICTHKSNDQLQLTFLRKIWQISANLSLPLKFLSKDSTTSWAFR